MIPIKNMPHPETIDPNILRKSQKDPEYLVREFLLEEGDTIKVNETPHVLGTRVDVIVTEPDGHWIKLKFIKIK